MDAAEHLRLLRIFHFVIAGLQVLGLLAIAFAIIAAVAIGLPPAVMSAYAVAGIVLVVAGILNLLAGLKMPAAGRNLSIAAAIIALLNIPLGTAFGIYALMVHFKFVPESA